MRISSVFLKEPVDGLQKIEMTGLGDIVVLTGSNGAGKSRVLKLLEKAITKQVSIDKIKIVLEDETQTYNLENSEDLGVSIINYSHYDDVFQLPKFYTPYVISQAKEKLENCNFEETTRNGLLFIEYITKYAESKNELKEFNKLLKIFLNNEIDEEDYTLFGFDIGNAKLSPGQQYLLRMCIALYCNKTQDKNLILFLDEPETHLHPDVLIKLIANIKKAFRGIQIWISTHSVALLSALNVSDIWHIDNGICKKLGSKSEPLMKSLVGDESQRLKLQQFVVWPENFACNQFAAECLKEPESVPYKKADKQISMVINELIKKLEEEKNITVVDYGTGKGRLLEGIGLEYSEILSKINYYAYDKYDDDAEICKEYMRKYAVDEGNYFNDITDLINKINSEGKADIVFLVNVLHEIEPKYWEEIFKNISELLSTEGYLILIEHSELTMGEKPYKSGFVVVQERAMDLLSGADDKVLCEFHNQNQAIARYLVPQKAIKNLNHDKVVEMLKEIRDIAIEKIYEVKDENISSFDLGIKLAFWTHQLASIEVIFAKNEI